ncbi:MAG TPA: carboxypeptidase-like regulatory domain-containing protein, partial [Flavobacteriales bacterium]|nr:carboxypeptidase-like regulatory domain-containing protein [Flavobacteriales bacterium]
MPAATNAVRHARSRMHALRTPLLLFFQLAVLCSWAQGTVDGRVRDKKDQSSLPGASVLLLLADDTTQRRSAVADPDGLFRIDNVAEGQYILRAA